jgi:hypothetical protein
MDKFTYADEDLSGIIYSYSADGLSKHLAGKHDQSSHGRKGSGSSFVKPNLNDYDRFRKDPVAFEKAMNELHFAFDPTINITDQVGIGFTESRFGFYSIPATLDSATPQFKVVEAQQELDLKKLDKDANEFIEKNPISVFTNEDSLELIIEEGSFATVHETGTKSWDYTGYRTQYERVAFGYDDSTPATQRPVYGAVRPAEIAQFQSGSLIGNYGSIEVVLKPETKSRATFTIGDSLDTFQKPFPLGGQVARTMNLAGQAANARSPRFGGDKGNMFDSPKWHETKYVEAQVHGGVKVSDIDKVIIHSGFYGEAILDTLDEAGIPYEIAGEIESD